jgi:hypothetical protein
MDIKLSAVELLKLRASLLNSVFRLVTPMLITLDHKKKALKENDGQGVLRVVGKETLVQFTDATETTIHCH